VVSAVAQFSQLTAGLGAAAGTTPSLAGIKQLIATEAGLLDSLDSSAPSEIAADFHTLRTAIDQASTQVQGATTIQQIGTAFSSFSTPAFSSASKNVSNYVGTSCGIKTSSST
jgi:hypothetical protein